MPPIAPPATLTLRTDLRAPAQAREFLRQVDCESTPDQLDTAQLLVSELVTNAVRYGIPPLTLAVDCQQHGGMRVRVTDGSARAPVLRDAAASEESGRGLGLVDLLSDDWGVHPSEDGKTVWFQLR